MIDNRDLMQWLDRLRTILNTQWDPIGDCPDDEYDMYRDKIRELIRDGATDDQLVDYLKWAEQINMGFGPGAEGDRERCAKRLADVVVAVRALGAPPS